jgi:hypothetical protein
LFAPFHREEFLFAPFHRGTEITKKKTAAFSDIRRVRVRDAGCGRVFVHALKHVFPVRVFGLKKLFFKHTTRTEKIVLAILRPFTASPVFASLHRQLTCR